MRRLPLLTLLLLAGCGASGQPDYCADVFCAVDCTGAGRKVDDQGCLTCECNTSPVSCAGLSEDACVAQPNCAPRYWDLGPSFGLPRYYGCRERETTTCQALACRMDCPGGLKQDANGCSTCECNPYYIDEPPECAQSKCLGDCAYGNVVGPNGCATCECNAAPTQPPVCALYCAYGFVTDDSGHAVCACNAAPVCPALGCDPYCPNGVAKDANGCDTCSCAAVDGGV